MVGWQEERKKGRIRRKYYGTIWYDDFYCENTLIFFHYQYYHNEKQHCSFFSLTVLFSFILNPFFWYAWCTPNRIYIVWFWSKWSKPNLNGHGSHLLLSKHRQVQFELMNKIEREKSFPQQSPTSKTQRNHVQLQSSSLCVFFALVPCTCEIYDYVEMEGTQLMLIVSFSVIKIWKRKKKCFMLCIFQVIHSHIAVVV